jgi:transposase-like protein
MLSCLIVAPAIPSHWGANYVRQRPSIQEHFRRRNAAFARQRTSTNLLLPTQIVALQFRPGHRAKLHSTKPIERLNGEIKRRMTEVVGILPNEEPSSVSSVRTSSSRTTNGPSSAPVTGH